MLREDVVSRAPHDATYHLIDCYERCIGLGCDAHLPLAAFRPFECMSVPGGIDHITLQPFGCGHFWVRDDDGESRLGPSLSNRWEKMHLGDSVVSDPVDNIVEEALGRVVHRARKVHGAG